MLFLETHKFGLTHLLKMPTALVILCIKGPA